MKNYFILWLLKVGTWFLNMSERIDPQETPIHPRKDAMSVPLTHYQYRRIEGALALVRYTTYDDDGRPIAVEQEIYREDEKDRLEEEMAAAMDIGIDCLLVTDRSIDDFALINGNLRALGPQ